MKTKLSYLLVFLFILGGSIHINAQSDAEKYWVLEDFADFEIQDDWIMEKAEYDTYPNNIKLTTIYANFEDSVDCAQGNPALRIRGLMENGSASFTVPNANRVVISLAGKKTDGDRIIHIEKNGTLWQTVENIDKRDCVEVVDEDPSEGEVTYTIKGGDINSYKPIVLYGIEVVKYGVTIEPEPEPDYRPYWIYEDFSKCELQDGGYIEAQSILSNPNNIPLQMEWTNVEKGEGCSVGSNNVRISGRWSQEGYLTFTVDDAQTVVIGLTGKAQLKDREVLVYKNNVLVDSFKELDRYECVQYIEEVNSNEPLTYKIVGAASNYGSPIAVTHIYVKKYTNVDINKIKDNEPKLYPNPVSDILNFNTKIDKAEIYNTNGQLLYSENNTENIDVSSLEKGFYIIRIFKEGIIYSHKLIKD